MQRRECTAAEIETILHGNQNPKQSYRVLRCARSKMEIDDGDGTSTKFKLLVVNTQDAFAPFDKKDDYEFETAIGHIEDLIIGESFQTLQNTFLNSYWVYFDDTEENKHCYMEIFLDYTNAIEEHIKSYLESKMTGFSMEKLINDVMTRKDSLDGEVFELLFTITDFTAFKEMFLDYKKVKTHGDMDLSSTLLVTSMSQRK